MTPALTDADREVLDRLAAEFLEFGHEDGWLGEAIALHFLAAGMERERKDAERYRWLCDGNGFFMEETSLCGYFNEKERADEEIDAAMARTRPPEER